MLEKDSETGKQGRPDVVKALKGLGIGVEGLEADSIIKHLDNDLFRYFDRKRKLPEGFREIRGSRRGVIKGSTHVSYRDWGWFGKHDYLVFVTFDENNPLEIRAILPAATPKWSEQKRKLEDRYNLRESRTKGAKDKSQTPRFKKYD